MVKAFVFGKFLPFHKGHEAMINFASTKCDFLTVLICCSDKESISDIVRKSWLQNTFAHEEKIEIKTFNYLESELPNTSKTSETVSEIWANIFKKLFPDYSILVTSEEYGYFVASFMNIQHIAFDIPKQLFPVSATAVRNNLFANWKYLPNSVKPHFVIKVVILGTESTGKTTLTKQLVRHFNCETVLETAREFIDNSNSFTFDDLHLLAVEHAKRIDKAILGNTPLVIIDTDIHITKSYAKFVFQRPLEVNTSIYYSNHANLYLYLNNDVEYFQDGTRLSEHDRNLLDLSHRQILAEHNINRIEIEGSWNERFVKTVEQINKLIWSHPQ